MTPDNSWDYVIVGAGTAGCVLAGRLSADPALRVLVIEAGRDMVPGREPRSIRDPFPSSYGDPQFAWKNLVAEVGSDPGDGAPVLTRAFTQGRLMGGSSSIMGMMAQRGLPSDFNEWERMGATGWGWQDVLPFFNRLENDWDFDGPLHGKEGPIPIRRYKRESWPPFVRAVAAAMEDASYQFNSDFNGFFGDCVTTVPMNNTPTQRVSAAMGYLDEAARRRPNLSIVTDATVERLLLDGTRVTGVVLRRADGSCDVAHGGEVLVCAGAIHSPTLLMRSGIGPADGLRRAGVTPVVDRPGIGCNLFNHAIAHLAVHLPRRTKQDRGLTSWACAMLRYSSGHPGCPSGDMQIFPTNRTSWHPLGRRIGALGVCLYKPFSTGTVELRSADPAQEPAVKFHLLSDPRDFDRMVDGLGFAARLMLAPSVRAVTNETFLPPGGQANKLNRPSRANWLRSAVISAVFDLPFGARRALLARSAVDLERLAADPDACRALVRRVGAGVHHVSGTCRIGRADDVDAVVDSACRVHGVAGLRVVDSSVMPTVVSANTHLAVLMIGEKVAQAIRDERTAAPSRVAA